MSHYTILRKIGLSKTAIHCYESLIKHGSANTAELARRLQLPQTGLYRVLERLAVQGFITTLKTNRSSIYFQARPLDTALKHFFTYQRQQVAPLLSHAKASQKTGHMSILTGRDEIFETYSKLASLAQHDLLTISIGEEVPEAIYDLAQAAASRGVGQYLLFQRHTQENDYWIKRWLAYGCHVRLVDGAGYHLNIIDRRYVILSSSNADNTDERTAILIESKPLVDEFRKYFFTQWRASRKLSRA